MRDDLTSAASSGAGSVGRTFVVGYMHSGTTLLLNVIRRNSAVFTTARETKFFDRLGMIRQAYPDLSDDRVLEDFTRFVLHIVNSGYRLGRDPTPPGSAPILLSADQFEELLSDVARSRQYADTFSIVQDHLARMAGRSHWLEKTPGHVFHIDRIARAIPDSRFVVAVRDPRDILASKKVRRAAIWSDKYREEERAYKSLIKSYDPVWDALSWKAAARAGLAAQQAHPDRVMTIRYEDLVAEPAIVVERLCDFLRLDFEPAMLEISSRNLAGERLRQSPSSHDGISNDSVQRWRKALVLEEVALCQWLVRTDMERLGYARVPVAGRHKLATAPLVARSGLEFIRRPYRRFLVGGTAYLKSVLGNYVGRFLRLIPRRTRRS